MTEEQSRNDPLTTASKKPFSFSLKLLLLVTTAVAAFAAFASHFPMLTAVPTTVFIFVVTVKAVMSSVVRALEVGADLMGVGPHRKASLLVFSSVSSSLCVVGAACNLGLIVFVGMFGALFSVMIWLAGRDSDIS
jgi:hypothetical protein